METVETADGNGSTWCHSRAVADSFGYSDAWPRADKGPKNAIHGEQTKREPREGERERQVICICDR